MATYENREAFIPYRRADVIELCIEDEKLDSEKAIKFREFCEVLSAYYHFKLHHTLESLKNNFTPFDPDTDTKPRLIPTEQQHQDMQANLIQTLGTVLEQANYTILSEAALQEAFEENSLIPLKTSVDFDEFENTLIYYRGHKPTTITIKQFYIREVKRTFDMYERVVILLKFKDEAYFRNKKEKIERLPFVPGKMYLSLYKNIPIFDLELLFPNIRVSMTLKDRLLLGIPAVGAAVPILIRALPSFGLVMGIVILLVWGPSTLTQVLNATDERVRDFYPVLTGLLMALVALGGFAFKQYTNYKNKRIEFQKDVTDTLFFHNLVNNVGVFNSIIDAAEEEETKEIILAYYHLLTHPQPLTKSQLDDHIENWLEQKFDTKIDFDVNNALHNLEEMRGCYMDELTNKQRESAILSQDEQGVCHVLPLHEAKMVIDHVWDNLFSYNS